MKLVNNSGPGPADDSQGSHSEPRDPAIGLAAAAATVFPEAGSQAPGPFDAVERLRILETLSYGLLYEGRVFQASRSEEVSLLELDPAFQTDPVTFGRVLADLLAASRIQRGSVLSPRGVFRHGDNLYVLFDASAGPSLATAFEFLGPAGLRLSSEAVLRIAGGVLAALDAPRGGPGSEDAGSCHGLLTPENIVVATGQRVLLRGFGLWPAGIGRLHLLGSNERRYLAPSQTREGLASPRTDLLSLGIILFEALVGLPAFDSPPEEDDLAELRGSIGEFQEKAEPGLSDLFEIVIACLTPPASPTPAYRGRLRKKIDTLFLREFSRDRVPKVISLDELVSRIKPRRPAIVKAKAMSLAPAEPEPEAAPFISERPATEAREEEDDEYGTVSLPGPVGEPQAPPPPKKPSVSYPPMTFGGPPPRRISRSLVGFAVVAAVASAIALIYGPWSRSSETGGIDRTSSGERVVIRSAATPVIPPLSPAPSVAAPPEIQSPPAVALEPVLRKAERRSRTDPSAGARRSGPGRESRRREPPRPRDRAVAPANPPAPSTSQAGTSAPGSVAAVPTGTLVSLQTPGLVAPVLLERPAPLRYQASDPRPALERSAMLEILVSDSGRVRGSRIVRAERIPSGFAEGVERYLAGMRFQPAQLNGVAVKVWMSYDLRYLAP